MPVSLAFILSLIAAAIFIVALAHLSVLYQSFFERRRRVSHAEPNQQDAVNQKQEGVSTNFVALIRAITQEGRAGRAEEQREDNAKQKREWLTIALLALTFGAIGWQVSEMIKVYDPIKEQSDTAHTALVAGQRAFVVADDLTIQPATADKHNIVYTMISETIENAGNTPTSDLQVYVGTYWDDNDLSWEVPNLISSSPDFTELELNTKSLPDRWSLGPKAKITLPSYLISEDNANLMRDGHLSIYVMGVAYYYDIVGGSERHKTKFCFKLFGWSGSPDNSGGWGTRGVDLSGQIPVISSRPCFHNNCTDKECGEEKPTQGREGTDLVPRTPPFPTPQQSTSPP